MSKLYYVNLELTKSQADVLLCVLATAHENDKNTTYSPAGIKEIEIITNQILSDYPDSNLALGEA